VSVDVRFQGGLDSLDPKFAFSATYLAELARNGADRADDALGALIADEEDLRPLAAKYGSNPTGFSKDLVEAYQELTTLGKYTSTRNS